MGKDCWKADDHQWGAGKTHLLNEDGKMTRCGRSLAITPGQMIEAANYNCKGCRAAKERAEASQERAEAAIEASRERVWQRPAPAMEHAPAARHGNTRGRGTDFPMPFGRHRGRPVYDLDDGYLEWLRDNVDLYGPLRKAVCAELGERDLENDSLEEGDWDD